MTRKLSLAGGVVALVAALTIPAASAAPAVQLSAKLKGAAEVPGPGDPNGKGQVFVAVKKQKRKVCFGLEFRRIGDPTAAHIHKGGPDDAGPVKVLLFEDSEGLPSPGAVDGCVRRVKKKIVRQLSRNPEKFYVNVHNDEFPDGAIRGQLGPAL
jgi:CHRD domain